MLATAACGDDISKNEAERGWRSTQEVMAKAGVGAGLSVSGMVGPDGVSGSVEGTVDCPEGGRLALSSNGEVTADEVTADLHLEFDGCKADGVTIDGSLDYVAEVSAERVYASYQGELTWSGKAKGSCIVDATAEVTSGGVKASYSGDVCGFAWSELD